MWRVICRMAGRVTGIMGAAVRCVRRRIGMRCVRRGPDAVALSRSRPRWPWSNPSNPIRAPWTGQLERLMGSLRRGAAPKRGRLAVVPQMTTDGHA